MLPFWSNYLIRTYAWIVLLNREGRINNALRWLGLIDEPLSLLYNDTAIVIGLVYGYLPFMVLPLYASIARLNPEIREAATDLGASSLRGFWTVTVPLTRQAIAAGCIFVFVPSIGNFITPDLLGGGRTKMIGNLIYDQFLEGAGLALRLDPRPHPDRCDDGAAVSSSLVREPADAPWLGQECGPSDRRCARTPRWSICSFTGRSRFSSFSPSTRAACRPRGPASRPAGTARSPGRRTSTGQCSTR